MTDSNQVALSSVSPDFEALVSQLQAALASKNSWVDILTSATGQTLIDFMCSIGAYDQLSIERAAQEVMLDSAQLESSILTIARLLGVRVIRKSPADVQVTLNNSDTTASYVIPAYTQFFINQNYYFNRDAIIFIVGQSTLTTTLYQGQLNNAQFISDGTSFQIYQVGNSDFAVSDTDIICSINNTTFTRTTTPLWQASATDTVFFDSTTADGNAEFTFGNNIYGVAPGSGTTILFTYATTLGSEGNVSITGQVVTQNVFSNITGTTSSNAADGADQRDPSFYKVLAPGMYSAKQRAVTRDQYRAIAATYPGVIDCLFRGQAETYPSDKTYMNIIFATILTNPVWNNNQWIAFTAFMTSQDIFGLQFNRVDPTSISINIVANVYCKTNSNLTNVEQSLITALNAQFALKLGTLGFNQYLSDIYATLLESTTFVDYVDVITPTGDTIVTALQYVVLNSITLNMFYSTRNNVTPA